MSSPHSEFENVDLRSPWQRMADRIWRGSAFLASALFHLVLIFVIFANIVFQHFTENKADSSLTANVTTEVTVQPANEPEVKPDEVVEEMQLKSPILLPSAVNPSAEPLPDSVVSMDTGAAPAIDASVGALDVLTVPGVGLDIGGGGGDIAMIDRVSIGGSYRTIVWRMTDQITVTSRGYKGVLLTWLMDSSISMRDDAQAIAQRVWDIYNTVKAEGRSISMSVIYFGEKPRQWLRPTDDIDNVMRALIAVPTDRSGSENVMAALDYAARTMPGGPEVKKIVCVLTDERGDDQDQLEATLNELRRQQVSVYVIGREAFFQHDVGYENYFDDEYRRQWTGVTLRGPETARYESFWLGQWSGPIPSGFGPYALSRIAVYSGGSYFLLQKDEDKTAPKPGEKPLTASGYDPDMLQYYRPDLSAAAAYDRNVRKDRVYLQLLRIYEIGKQIKPIYDGPCFTREEFGAVRNRIEANLKLWREIVTEFDKNVVPTLQLQRMKERRWAAHYDAARATASVALYNTYQDLLSLDRAREKDYPFKLLKIAHGSLAPIANSTEAQFRDHLVRAFKDVADRHPSTPWAKSVEPMLKSNVPHLRSWQLDEYVPPRVPPDYTPPPPPPGPKPI